MESAERVEDLLVQGQSSVKQKLYLVKGRIPRLEAWGEVNSGYRLHSSISAEIVDDYSVFRQVAHGSS